MNETRLYHREFGPPPNGKDVDLETQSISEWINQGWADHPKKLDPEHALGKAVKNGELPAIEEGQTIAVISNDSQRVKELEKALVDRNKRVTDLTESEREKIGIINAQSGEIEGLKAEIQRLAGILEANKIDYTPTPDGQSGETPTPDGQSGETPTPDGDTKPADPPKRRGRPPKAETKPDTAEQTGEGTGESGQTGEDGTGEGETTNPNPEQTGNKHDL